MQFLQSRYRCKSIKCCCESKDQSYTPGGVGDGGDDDMKKVAFGRCDCANILSDVELDRTVTAMPDTLVSYSSVGFANDTTAAAYAVFGTSMRSTAPEDLPALVLSGMVTKAGSSEGMYT